MQIVINISKDDLNAIKYLKVKGWASRHELLILNGTPLPKGHGRLIDADAYAKKYDTNINGNTDCEYVFAPTIIEADKESEELSMADIELVIKIPEVYYEALRKTDIIVSGQRSGKTLMSVIYNAVANGTPLPKGHGKLIDADALYADLAFPTQQFAKAFRQILDDAPTMIIPADKEVD